MTQVHGNATPNAAAQDDRTGLSRLIGAGLILVGVVLLALGAWLGPVRYATSTPGKLTVNNCTVEYKYRSASSSSRKKTKTRWCYGTFTANDGSAKDLNAELRSDAFYQKGHVIDARKSGDTGYQLDKGWLYAIAVGAAWAFGALIALSAGIFTAVTGFPYGQSESRGLFKGCMVAAGVGVVGLVVSLLVAFFA